MRTIIDTNGLPDAAAYYEMFPREPSPAGDIAIRHDEIIRAAQINLERVLDEMIRAGNNAENEVLIVAHGEPRGFLMHLTARGGVSAMKAALEILSNAGAARARRDRIRQMAANQQVAAWTAFIESLAPGTITGTITVQDAERFFTQWFNGQARSLSLSPAQLETLVGKMNQVRAFKFRRVEVRACNIGKDQTALAALRSFFGAAKLLAPTTTTFYASVIPQVLSDPRRLRQWIQSGGGPLAGGVYARRRGPVPRVFQDIILPAGGRFLITRFQAVTTFSLMVWETSLHPHLFGTRAATLDWIWAQLWVRMHILPGATYTRGLFRVAGLWTFDDPNRSDPYILPADSEYRRLIASDPP